MRSATGSLYGLLALLGIAGCVLAEASSPRDGGAPRDAARWADAAAKGADAGRAPPKQTGMITDDECVRRGGLVHTYSPTTSYRDVDPDTDPVREVRVCTYSHQKNGQRCRNDSDCTGGRCRCTGALSGPHSTRHDALRNLDGKPAWGVCSDSQLMSGVWYCLVRDGKIRLSGIIID
jgi:hypothetical protein